MTIIQLLPREDRHSADRWRQFNSPDDPISDVEVTRIGKTCREIEALKGPSQDRTIALLSSAFGEDWRVFFPVLQTVWNSCRGRWNFREHLLDALEVHHRERGWVPPVIEVLPEKLKVFRGSWRTRVHGLSWSLDIETAKRRAMAPPEYEGQTAILASGDILRDDIYAFITQRGDREVIIDPARLTEFRMVEWSETARPANVG